MGHNGDHDIKIAGTDSRQSCVEDAEFAQLIEQNDNGNLAKARCLGASLAGSVDVMPQCSTAGLDSSVAFHQRVLALFSVVICVEERLIDQLLIHTTLNVFYDTLKKEHPELYDALSSSGGFTFYYLACRRGGKREADVGSAFAMLCGDEHSVELQHIGTKCFISYFEYASALINEITFA